MSQLEPGTGPDGKQILWLRRLVTLLTATMVLGVGILVALALSVYLGAGSGSAPDWPTDLALPQGENLEALTRSEDWLIAVTRTGSGAARAHVLSPDGQSITRTIELP